MNLNPARKKSIVKKWKWMPVKTDKNPLLIFLITVITTSCSNAERELTQDCIDRTRDRLNDPKSLRILEKSYHQRKQPAFTKDRIVKIKKIIELHEQLVDLGFRVDGHPLEDINLSVNKGFIEQAVDIKFTSKNGFGGRIKSENYCTYINGKYEEMSLDRGNRFYRELTQ